MYKSPDRPRLACGPSPSLPRQVVDRPKQGHRFLSRDYVQPQWVFDSANFRVLMPVELYQPGAVPPPHLSPFVGEDDDGYTPEFAKTVKRLQVGPAGHCVDLQGPCAHARAHTHPLVCDARTCSHARPRYFVGTRHSLPLAGVVDGGGIARTWRGIGRHLQQRQLGAAGPQPAGADSTLHRHHCFVPASVVQ